MISERLSKAPDRVTRQEYEIRDGKKRLKARVCSSKNLGLEEREDYEMPVPEARARRERGASVVAGSNDGKE